MIPAEYAHCTVRLPVKHRRKVPFHPVVEVPTDFAERALEMRRLDAELERFVLRAEDYFQLATEAMAQNIHYSTKLEGNQVSLPEVRRLTRRSMKGEKPPAKNPGVQEILNHLVVWRAPFLDPPWRLENIAALHEMLLADADLEAEPGKFRSRDIEVYEGDTVAFLPAPHQHIREELDALLLWTNRQSSGFFPVVAATVLFHRFESIHPFLDGNGRVGRTLFHTYLQQHGLRHAHLCIVEPELVSNSELYYTLLAWVDDTDVYVEMVDYFTNALLKAYRSAVQRFGDKDLLSSDLDETAKRLLIMGKRSKSEFSVAEAARWVDGRAEDTVRRHLNRLVDLGALASRGQTRSKRYRFADPFEKSLQQGPRRSPGVRG